MWHFREMYVYFLFLFLLNFFFLFLLVSSSFFMVFHAFACFFQLVLCLPQFSWFSFVFFVFFSDFSDFMILRNFDSLSNLTPGGCFLLWAPVRTAQQSQKKSESLCYLIFIMTGNKTPCFPPIYETFFKPKYCFI